MWDTTKLIVQINMCTGVLATPAFQQSGQVRPVSPSPAGLLSTGLASTPGLVQVVKFGAQPFHFSKEPYFRRFHCNLLNLR